MEGGTNIETDHRHVQWWKKQVKNKQTTKKNRKKGKIKVGPRRQLYVCQYEFDIMQRGVKKLIYNMLKEKKFGKM